MAEAEDWTTEANEALTISLVKPTEDGIEKIETFNPNFTYPIFEDERIFGYKGLKLNLLFNATDLRPNFSASYKKKFKTVGAVEATDVVEIMKEFLPGVAFQKKLDFEHSVKQTAEKWTPPGELVKTIEREGKTFEIWKGSLADLSVRQLVKRIQICVLFYIEGGSYIGEDAAGKEEPEYSLARWSVYFLYEKQSADSSEAKPQYIFQGYATVYNFWLYEFATPPESANKEEGAAAPEKVNWELPTKEFPYAELPHRARISQFLILPPFQGKGAGSILYRTIFDIHLKDSSTKEVTVEDPNEDFDLLRDICDLKHLRQQVPEFAELKVNPNVKVPEKGGVLLNNTAVSLPDSASGSDQTIVDISALEDLRRRVKIAPRQFSRLVEIQLMSKLPDSVRPQVEADENQTEPSEQDKRLYALWRMLLKQRLYRRNIAILGEFEVTERIIKLNETLSNVEWEYARIIERLGTPRPAEGEFQRRMDQFMASRPDGSSNGKRKADDEEPEETGDGETSSARKKARVEDA